MRSVLASALLVTACGARTGLSVPEPVDASPEVGALDTVDLAPVDDCASRATTCPNWDLWPRKRLAEIAEACFAETGRTCGTFDIRFEAPGCAVAFERVESSVSRAFLDCVRDTLAKERWLCRQEGGTVRFFEGCAKP